MQIRLQGCKLDRRGFCRTDGIFALYLHQPHRFAISPGYAILIQEIDQGDDVPTFTRAAVDGET